LQLQQTMHEKMQMQQQIEVDGVEGKQLPRWHRYYRTISVFLTNAMNEQQRINGNRISQMQLTWHDKWISLVKFCWLSSVPRYQTLNNLPSHFNNAKHRFQLFQSCHSALVHHSILLNNTANLTSDAMRSKVSKKGMNYSISHIQTSSRPSSTTDILNNKI
jgi:hypothetical protein